MSAVDRFAPPLHPANPQNKTCLQLFRPVSLKNEVLGICFPMTICVPGRKSCFEYVEGILIAWLGSQSYHLHFSSTSQCGGLNSLTLVVFPDHFTRRFFCCERSLRERIRYLFLAGNPLALLPFYRQRTIRGCGPQLAILDDLEISKADRAAAAEVVIKEQGLLHDAASLGACSSSSSRQTADMGGTFLAAGKGDGDWLVDMVHFSVQVMR